MGGEPGAVVFFGEYVIKPGLEVIACRESRVLGAEERDGVLELAAVGAQLEGGQRVQGVPGLVYSRWRAWGHDGCHRGPVLAGVRCPGRDI
jgi:hypothetical protein